MSGREERASGSGDKDKKKPPKKVVSKKTDENNRQKKRENEELMAVLSVINGYFRFFAFGTPSRRPYARRAFRREYTRMAQSLASYRTDRLLFPRDTTAELVKDEFTQSLDDAIDHVVSHGDEVTNRKRKADGEMNASQSKPQEPSSSKKSKM